ncbi:MAG: dihydrofolate reductase [Bacteroidia bacterium]|nr:dihydrofolate reductase [Bacteroidia bacterium]
MRQELIVAMSKNRVIGKAGRMPWHLPADLHFFKQKTLGNTVVMGRKTFESIGKPLPGRLNIVLSRSPKPSSVPESVLWLNQWDISSLPPIQGTLFWIGGEQIFRFALQQPDLSTLHITQIESHMEGDTFFPELSSEWILKSEQFYPNDEKNCFDLRFQTWVRQ